MKYGKGDTDGKAWLTDELHAVEMVYLMML
jgi:hypothetical protein